MEQTQSMESEGDSSEAVKRVFRVCKKGRWLIGSAALVSVVATTVGLAFAPSKYQSEATILIMEQEISSNLATPLSTLPVAQKLQVMTQEVLSRSRLLDIVSEFGLFAKEKNLSPDAAVDLMRKAIDIKPIDASAGSILVF